VLIPARTAADLFAGWWVTCHVGSGAAGAGLGRRGCDRVVARRAQRADHRLPGSRGRWDQSADLSTCRPRSQGLIERAHDYFERSFLPGRTGSARFAPPLNPTSKSAPWLTTTPPWALTASIAQRMGVLLATKTTARDLALRQQILYVSVGQPVPQITSAPPLGPTPVGSGDRKADLDADTWAGQRRISPPARSR
jgi:hypothetical protein